MNHVFDSLFSRENTYVWSHNEPAPPGGNVMAKDWMGIGGSIDTVERRLAGR